MDLRRNILWIDGLSGLLVGGLMLLTSSWLMQWYKFPGNLLFLVTLANLAYGTYSFSIAALKKRPKILIVLLVLANLAWTVICSWLIMTLRETASLLGLLHLTAEALYAGGLAFLEWRWREMLQTK